MFMSNLSKENHFCPVCTFNLHKAFNQTLGNVHDFYVADPELYQLIDGIKKVIKFIIITIMKKRTIRLLMKKNSSLLQNIQILKLDLNHWRI